MEFPADLVTFNEEILNGKLHFLCSVKIFSCQFVMALKNVLKAFPRIFLWN